MAGMAMRTIFTGGKGGGKGGELRSSLRIQRATKGLDCDIKLSSRSRTAQMKAGGSFKMLSLLMLLDTHGPKLRVECTGPDSEYAYGCIRAAMDGHTTKAFGPEDRGIIAGQGQHRQEILADLPPQASARWLAWLREDPARTLPWGNDPLPPEHENRYPYTQMMGGLTSSEAFRRASKLSPDELNRVSTLNVNARIEYLCAPQEVRRQMLDAISDPDRQTG